MNKHVTPPVEIAANTNSPKELWRRSLVLAALENLMKYDDDPALKKAVCRRYLDLKDHEEEPDL